MESTEEPEQRKSLPNESSYLHLLTPSLSFHAVAASPLPPQRLIFPHTTPQLLPLKIPPLFGAPPAPTNPTAVDIPRSSSSRPIPRRRRQTGKSDTIPPPLPWATNRRATVHTFNYLMQHQIFTIKGHVRCKTCQEVFEIEFDLKDKFSQVWSLVGERRFSMYDTAPSPSVWTNPTLPTCKYCQQENSAEPVIAEKKRSINWLFLFLGQMLGCCTLKQLNYFCKHTNDNRDPDPLQRCTACSRISADDNRRIGSSYLTYLELCRQLDPDGWVS